MNDRISSLLADMATEVHLDPDEAVRTIGEYARAAVDGDDSGIMLIKAKGKVETPVGTSPRVDEAHAMQAEIDEGPCLDASRGEAGSFLVVDTLAERRWPVWGPLIADIGYRSSASARLQVGKRRFGSLNVYSKEPDAFEQGDVEVLEMLARHASVALANAQNSTDLQTALDSRTLIGQAQGVLMHAYSVDADTSFAYLRRISQNENLRLVEVARRVVENGGALGSPDETA